MALPQPRYRFIIPIVALGLLLLSWIIRQKYFGHSDLANGLFTSAMAILLLNSFLLMNTKRARILLVSLLVLILGGFWWWRQGEVVARATFDPGIAPFSIE